MHLARGGRWQSPIGVYVGWDAGQQARTKGGRGQWGWGAHLVIGDLLVVGVGGWWLVA
jgi:hypothetical protein